MPKSVTESVPYLFDHRLIDLADAIAAEGDTLTLKVKGYAITYARRIDSGWRVELSVSVAPPGQAAVRLVYGAECDEDVRTFWEAAAYQQRMTATAGRDRAALAAATQLREILDGHPDY